MQSTATVSLKLESRSFSQQVAAVGDQLSLLQVGATGAAIAFRGVGMAARTGAAEFVVGGVAVEKINRQLAAAAISSDRLSSAFGVLADTATGISLVSTALVGVAQAARAFSQVPQTLATMQASGVSTRTIEDFELMRSAIAGSQLSVEQFVSSSIARLGQFEQAAARSATILRSTTRFDDSGTALRVNAQESLANALSIQNLVSTKLDNAVSSSDALIAQYEVLSGGFTNQLDSEKVLEAALKLTQISKAGGMSTDTAENTKLITKSLQAYNLGAGDAAQTAATLNAVVDTGITTIQELSNGFGAAGASASKAGITMSALGAGVAVLTSIGQDTSEALTGLKGLSDSIINKTPEAAQELAKLSFEGKRIRFDTAEVQTKGFTQALIDLYKAAGNSPQTLAKIFPDAISYRAAIGLLTADGARFKSTFDAVNSATVQSLDDVASIAASTRIVEMEKLANKFGEIIITVAQSIAPVVEPGLNFLRRIADGFAALPDPLKQAIGSLIVAQLTAKAAGEGFAILGKTLLELGGIYATFRVGSLLMSGQLGSELMIIKELIVQRKGLGAVMLQAIGINQRYRLGVDATSTALRTQGAIATTVANIGARASGAAQSAVAAGRNILARNVSAAQVTATNIAAARPVGVAVNGVVGAVATVSNSQTAQNIRAATTQFVANNPAIGTAVTEVRAAATAATAQIRAVVATTVASIGASQQVVAAVAAIPSAQAIVASQVEQLASAELELKSPELSKRRSKLATELAGAEEELEFLERNRQAKRDELERRKNRYTRDVQRFEEIAPDLTDHQRIGGRNKLNKDAAKISNLAENLVENAQPIADLQRRRSRISRELNGVERIIDDQIRISSAKFIRVAELGGKVERLSESAAKSAEIAKRATEYADNLNRLTPNSDEAITATTRARIAERRATAIESRRQALQGSYDSLLESSGGRAALLNAQGLRDVNFAGRRTTVSNSGLENILYADVKSAVVRASTVSVDFIKGSLKALPLLASSATAAALSLGKLSVSAVLNRGAGVGTAIKSGISTIAEGFKAGGIKGIITSGLNTVVGGSAGLGTRLLPMVPPQLAAAAGALAVPLVVGALTLREDVQRAGLAGDFRQSVEDTLKRDREITAKFTDRTRPLDEVRAAVERLGVAQSQPFKFTPIPGQVPIPSGEQGVVSSILGIPGSIAKATSTTVAQVKNNLDRDLSPKVTSTEISQSTKIDPIRNQLKLLASSGELTAAQFSKLDQSLTKMGKSGVATAADMRAFTIELDTIRAQSKPQSRGVVDAIGGYGQAVINAPGDLFNYTMGGLDNIANTIGAAVNLPGKVFNQGISALDPRKFFDGIQGNKNDREADSLISYLGDNGSLVTLTKEINLASTRTEVAVKDYSSGIAIDAVNRNKIAAGEKLVAGDIERENNAIKSYIAANQNLVADYDKQLETLNKSVELTKDPGNKSALLASINALKLSKQELEKNTAAVKNSGEAFAKYNLETLPGLSRALNENSDPVKAVELAKEDFEQQYQKDGAGKISSYVKSIAELRQDSSKLVDAAIQNYQISNDGNAEEVAIANIKAVRDNQISLQTGETGFRETIANRLNLTDQIIKIQAAETERTIGLKNIEAERIKSLNIQGRVDDRQAQIESEAIAIESAQIRLAAKENEIIEYAQYPKKVVELEQQAAVMRVQIEQQVASQQKAVRDRQNALLQAQLELRGDYLKTAQSKGQLGAIDANLAESRLEIEKTSTALQKLLEDRRKLSTDSPELNNQIARAEQQLQQQNARLEQNIRDRSVNLSQSGLELRGDYLKTANLRNELSGLDTSLAQSRLELEKTSNALNKLYEDRRRLTTDSPELNNQIARTEQQFQQQKAGIETAAKNRQIGLADNKFELRIEYLKTAQARLQIGEIHLISATSAIEIDKTTEALRRLYLERQRLKSPSPELNNQIAIAEQKQAQAVANRDTQIFDANLSLAQRTLVVDGNEVARPLTITNQQIELAQKLGDIQGSIANAERELFTSRIDNQNSQLEIDSKLSRTAVERAEIELKQSRLKLDSLGQVQVYERQSLQLQIQLSELGLRAEANRIKIARLDQEKAVKELELQQLKLDRDKSNSPEQQIKQRELTAQLDTARSLLGTTSEQELILDRQIEASKKINLIKLQNNDAQQLNNQKNAILNRNLSEIGVKTGRITEFVDQQTLAFNAQVGILNNRVGVLDLTSKQLDNQTKSIQTQANLTKSIFDARLGEVNILSELTTIEGSKLDIAQTAAAIKLSSLQKQLVFERQLLEINIQQKEANLEQDKLRQEVAKAQSESDVLSAQSSVEKLRIDPRSSPLDIRRAELDLSAKQKQYNLTLSQDKILEKQREIIRYQANVDRYQLDLSEKSKTQQAILEYSNALPQQRKAFLQNDLSNAIINQESLKYYQDLIKTELADSKESRLPIFNSPYDPASNFNRFGSEDPNKLPVPTYPTGLGNVDVFPEDKRISASEYFKLKYPNGLATDLDLKLTTPPPTKLRSDARDRYEDFVARPINFDGGLNRSAQPVDRSPEIKPVTVNLVMNNNTKIDVANAQESKESMMQSTLGAIEGVVRLVKERY